MTLANIYRGLKLNSKDFVAVVIFIPHKLHLLAIHHYWQELCPDVGWCQLAWGTMETRLVYFFIVKWTLHSACFYQQSNDTNLHFRSRLMPPKNKSYFNVIYACWIHQVRRKSDVLPGLTSVGRHNLIGYFFCQKRFHWLTQSTGLNNLVLSESTESLDNVQLTMCTPVL